MTPCRNLVRRRASGVFLCNKFPGTRRELQHLETVEGLLMLTMAECLDQARLFERWASQSHHHQQERARLLKLARLWRKVVQKEPMILDVVQTAA